MDKTDILKSIADNKLLLTALKELILEQFKDDRTDDSAFSDERLGQMYRAIVVGRNRVEQAFQELEKYSSTDIASAKINRAR